MQIPRKGKPLTVAFFALWQQQLLHSLPNHDPNKTAICVSLENFTRFYFFQTLNRTESMVSLCFRNLAGYVNDDNLPGLQSFLENKEVQVDDRDEVSFCVKVFRGL